MNMTLMPHYKRDYAVWISAIGCQCARRIHSDLAQCCGKTMKAAKLTELDDQLCGDAISYEAKSRENDWLVALHETEQDRRYISRATAAHALGAINRNCPAP